MYQNPTGLPYCEQPPVLGVLSCQWLPNNQKSISPFRKHSQCCGFLCSFPFPFLFSPFPFSFFSFLHSPFLSLFFLPFSTTLLSSSPFLLYHHYYYCSPYYIQHKTSGCASPVWMVPSMGYPDSPASNWLWIRLVALTVSVSHYWCPPGYITPDKTPPKCWSPIYGRERHPHKPYSASHPTAHISQER